MQKKIINLNKGFLRILPRLKDLKAGGLFTRYRQWKETQINEFEETFDLNLGLFRLLQRRGYKHVQRIDKITKREENMKNIYYFLRILIELKRLGTGDLSTRYRYV